MLTELLDLDSARAPATWQVGVCTLAPTNGQAHEYSEPVFVQRSSRSEPNISENCRRAFGSSTQISAEQARAVVVDEVADIAVSVPPPKHSDGVRWVVVRECHERVGRRLYPTGPTGGVFEPQQCARAYRRIPRSVTMAR